MRRILLLATLVLCVDSSRSLAHLSQPDRSQAPPVTLTASDGAGLRITSFQARAAIEDPLAFTELRLTFHNPEPRQIEALHRRLCGDGATSAPKQTSDTMDATR